MVNCRNRQRCLHFRLLLEDLFEQLSGIVKNVDRHGKTALFLIMTDSYLRIIQAKTKAVHRRKSVNNATISYTYTNGTASTTAYTTSTAICTTAWPPSKDAPSMSAGICTDVSWPHKILTASCATCLPCSISTTSKTLSLVTARKMRLQKFGRDW